MAQFDVYRNRDRATVTSIPFLLDVQNGFFADMRTRLVVPLMAAGELTALPRRLNPHFRVDDRDVTMMTQLAAAVPVAALGAPVASLAASRDDIIAALDFLITGI